MAALNLDLSTYTASTGQLEPIPENWYPLAVTKTEVGQTKEGTGVKLSLTLKVMEGQFANRTIFDMLNIRNTNKDTEKWARETLRAYTDAMNLPPNLPDSDMMLNIPIMCKVGIKRSEGYDPRNVIRTIRPMGFNPNMPTGGAQQGHGMPAQTGFQQRPQAPQMPAGFAQQPMQQQPIQQPIMNQGYMQQPQYGGQQGFQQPQMQQMSQGYNGQPQMQQQASQGQQQGFPQQGQQFTQATQQWEQPVMQQQEVPVEQPQFNGFQASQHVPQNELQPNGVGGNMGGSNEEAPWN